MTTTGPRMKPIRTKLAAAAAACALLTTAAMASAGAASASAAPARASSAALRAALHRDLSRYLTARRTAEHISAVSLRVTFPGVCMRLEQRRAELTAHTPQKLSPQAHAPRPGLPSVTSRN